MPEKSLYKSHLNTPNIFNVIFTVFMCVPFSNVILLYGLHLKESTQVLKSQIK